MCIIVIQPEGYTMTEEQILDFVSRNPHGFGFMWADDKGVHMKKIVSASPKVLVDFYRKHAAGKPGVLHYRYATSGPVDEHMAHPFKVSDDLLVVHNGVLAGGSDKESDTSQFVREVLKPALADDYTRLYEPAMKKWIEDQIGGSSLVFLDRDGVVTQLGRKGVEWDSCWYSNTYAWTLPPELGGRPSRRSTHHGDPRLYGTMDTWEDETPVNVVGDNDDIADYVQWLDPNERIELFASLDERVQDGDTLSDEEIALYIELEDVLSDEPEYGYADAAAGDWSSDPEDVTDFLLAEMRREEKKRKNPKKKSRKARRAA